MTDLHAADDHATPLTPAERDDLIPTYITTRGELNQAEQKNIATADRWALAAVITFFGTGSSKASIGACSMPFGAGPESRERRNATSASNRTKSKARCVKPSTTQVFGWKTTRILATKSQSDFIIGLSRFIRFRTVTGVGRVWRLMC